MPEPPPPHPSRRIPAGTLRIIGHTNLRAGPRLADRQDVRTWRRLEDRAWRRGDDRASLFAFLVFAYMGQEESISQSTMLMSQLVDRAPMPGDLPVPPGAMPPWAASREYAYVGPGGQLPDLRMQIGVDFDQTRRLARAIERGQSHFIRRFRIRFSLPIEQNYRIFLDCVAACSYEPPARNVIFGRAVVVAVRVIRAPPRTGSP